MSSPHLLFQLNKSEDKYFNYKTLGGGGRVSGAFRAIGVDGLVRPKVPKDPELKIYEFQDIKYGNNAASRLSALGKSKSGGYVAISHVWEAASDVHNQLEKMDVSDLLNIDTNSPSKDALDTKTLSWPGLIQMAQATDEKRVKYFWLDLLCIDQVDRDDEDMDYQICIMADLYRWASCVIVMIGGAGCVQHPDQATGWMDRAWTLQEAVVNKNNTYVYLKWPVSQKRVPKPSDPKKHWIFHEVKSLSKAGDIYVCCLVGLDSLLDMADAESTALSKYPTISVLNGVADHVGNAPRLALRAARAPNKQVKYMGAWRSMYMRTSSRPVDVVYSIMGVFGLQVDPFKKNRDPTFIFNDLARKTAAKVGPAWLIIGGVTGSDIPINPDSYVIPEFPHTEKAGVKSDNKPAKMNFRGRWEWVSSHVDHSPDYIESFRPSDQAICFLTHSQPHIINATMIPLNEKPYITTKDKPVQREGVKNARRTVAHVKLGREKGRCVYYGNLTGTWRRPGEIQAVLVGKVGNMRDKGIDLPATKKSYKGGYYFLFFHCTRKQKRWRIVANGVWTPSSSSWRPPSNKRFIFTVRENGHGYSRKWPADDNYRFDQRHRRFCHSYGVDPLVDRPPNRPRVKLIQWFGSKHTLPKRHGWSEHHIRFDILTGDREDYINKFLGQIGTLNVVSCSRRREDAPPSSKAFTSVRLVRNGALDVPYSYGGWKTSVCTKLSKLNLDGLIVPKENSPSVRYYLRIRFGDRVMYVQMKQHWHTDPDYVNTWLVPYSYPNNPFRTMNKAFLTSY
ncbi:hypothetical protein SLS62_010731 [Diatrype stigma]|uniref:Heterokaryon incompatibility domain-containing protein n=1 Tax=Diatrype stigma TaxID=117547 RepID=A0AAN9U7L7_9PEZI